MLFIESYDAKSLDRSSVSMIDKYNERLNIVEILLTRLSALIDNLLSLIRDVRNTLGQCKQRVYDNLNQVKEVISGNDISGTESTVNVIESALAAGDKAIEQAEATLEGVQQEINCNEGGTPTQPVNEDCGENCNEEVEVEAEDDCNYCSFTIVTNDEDGTNETPCAVCQLDGCSVDTRCDESMGGYFENAPTDGCQYSTAVTVDPSCIQFYSTTSDGRCGEVTCNFSDIPGLNPPSDCTFGCNHSTGCSESPMPENCTYTCTDGEGCNYDSSCAECAYGTICNESCDQTDSEIEACGNCGEGYGCGDWSEFCGEVGGGSTGRGDEGCGDCGDCDNCGEGEGCGDWSEFCGE